MSVEMRNMAKSEAKKRADDKYRRKYLDYITILTRKEDRIRDLVGMASEKSKKSRNTYMLDSILAQLSHDGITIDMLPKTEKYIPQVEPKQPKQYMIYMITERHVLDTDDDPEKYIAMFPTLKAAEKYARSKFDKKAYPADWNYTILGRYMEGENQREAWDKLKEIVKKELEADRHGEVGREDDLTYIERINLQYPTEYIDIITCDNEDAKSSLDDLDFVFEDGSYKSSKDNEDKNEVE